VNIILKYIFYISVLFLVFISLFPGSIIGYFFYGDIEKQPILIKNSFGSSINHFICYLYVSLLGFFLHLRNPKFKKVVQYLLLLSVILELLHLVVPHRLFEITDLFGNILGVLVAYSAVKIYLLIIKS
jgi:hypothetical protein